MAEKEITQEPGDVNPEIIPEAPPQTVNPPPETAVADESPTDAPMLENTEQEPGPETESQPNDNQKKLEEVVLRFYPDADVSGPDALMASLVPLVESIVSFHDDLNEVVEEFPEFGDFIIGLRKGYTPQQAIAMYFDMDSLTPPEGAEDEEAVRTAKEERRKKVEEHKAWETKLPENQEVTSKNFAKVVKELELDDATQKSIVDNLESILKDAKDSVISEDHWRMLANGLRHETVVAEKEKEKEMAVEDAKIAGRNEQIEKKRITKDTGDGLPKLTNSGSTPIKPKKKPLIPTRKEFRV